MSEKESKSKSDQGGNIQVYVRIRPSINPYAGFTANTENNTLEFNFDEESHNSNNNNNPKLTGHALTSAYQNNKLKTSHKFQFNGIFPMETTQEEVFNTVAKGVIDDGLNGINRDQDSNGDASRLEDLPKVQLKEDEDGNTHLRNLSVNLAQTEEDALNLLFLGDTNRVVAETPMNDASTRSHCLFIIWIESAVHGGDRVKRSKIHLVDLAGSERVSKTGVEGQLLNESKYINISLHFLEMVIVALQEKTARGTYHHIPYRNSMMTQVLRDSLGGNCKTLMIGNIAVEGSNIDESISTCRFAQRVSMIKNTAIVNEELDPRMMIKRLKGEIAELKDEIRVLKGGEDMEEEEISLEEEQKLKVQIQEYIDDRSIQSILCGGRKKTQKCFGILREMVYNGGGNGNGGQGGTGGKSSDNSQSGQGGKSVQELSKTVQQLKMEIAQRDNEIGILVGIVNRDKDGNSKGPAPVQQSQNLNGSIASESTAIGGGPSQYSSTDSNYAANDSSLLGQDTSQYSTNEQIQENQNYQNSNQTRPRQRPTQSGPEIPRGKEAAELLLDRTRAFDLFRKSIRRNEGFEENKELLRSLYGKAKSIGEEANDARNIAGNVKKELQRVRLEKGMANQNGVNEDGTDASDQQQNAIPPTAEETQLLKQLESSKQLYFDKTNNLRKVKHDIERIQNLLEQNKKRLQRDFENWFINLRKEATAGLEQIVGEVRNGNVNNNSGIAKVATEAGVNLNYNNSQSNHIQSQNHCQEPHGPNTSSLIPKSSYGNAGRSPVAAAQNAPYVSGDARIDAEISGFYSALNKMK